MTQLFTVKGLGNSEVEVCSTINKRVHLNVSLQRYRSAMHDEIGAGIGFFMSPDQARDLGRTLIDRADKADSGITD